jgi:hypothetical protein
MEKQAAAKRPVFFRGELRRQGKLIIVAVLTY